MAMNDDWDYGISREGNKVRIDIGHVTFPINPDSAIKMACLLMKYAGASVRILSGSVVATYSKKSLRDGPQDQKPLTDPARLLN